MSIARNIKMLRKKAGKNQIEVAKALGISIATLRRWEAGETAPTGANITELARILDVTPEAIVAVNPLAEEYQAEAISNNASNKTNSGMLVFEHGGTRIELPPTDKGYEIFSKLIENTFQK